MFALLEARLDGVLDVLLAGDFLDLDDLADGRQLQGFRQLRHHLLRSAYQENFFDLFLLNHVHHALPVLGVGEQGGLDGADIILFLLGRPAGQDGGVVDQEAVIDDVGHADFLGQQLGAEALAGAALAHQGVDLHALQPSLDATEELVDLLAGQVDPLLVLAAFFRRFAHVSGWKRIRRVKAWGIPRAPKAGRRRFVPATVTARPATRCRAIARGCSRVAGSAGSAAGR